MAGAGVDVVNVFPFISTGVVKSLAEKTPVVEEDPAAAPSVKPTITSAFVCEGWAVIDTADGYDSFDTTVVSNVDEDVAVDDLPKLPPEII